MSSMIRAVVAVLVLLCASSSASAQLTVTAGSAPAPDGLAAPIKTTLASASVKVTTGDTALEFWCVTALPAATWSAMAEGALVGAVRIAGPFKEIRGRTIKPGVYTLRYALQPQNGDHLGASAYREFLLLSPAALDTDPKPLGFEGSVAVSKAATGISHPATLSLDPPVASAAPLSMYTSELGHQGVVFEIGTLRFGLIILGLIEH